jgi:large subunit ribosomal protein L4
MARAGSTRSPNRKGGGRAFPKIPRSFAFVLPSQVRAFGLRSVLSAKYAQNKLVIIDSTSLETHKTAHFRYEISRYL